MATYTLEDVKNIVIKLGHEPLFNEYKNNKSKLKCRCKKHGIFYPTLVKLNQALKNGFNGCKKCADENRNNDRKITLKQARDIVIKLGLIPLFTEYKNNQTPLLVKCPIHGEFKITIGNAKRAIKNNTNGCIKCFYDKIRICSKDEREKARDTIAYRAWQKSVYKKNNYTCQKCGKHKLLHAHHILNFASHPELRTEISNGITFCKECHIEFHKKYTKYNNTEEQVKEFINSGNLI